jgi:hypothetical protein
VIRSAYYQAEKAWRRQQANTSIETPNKKDRMRTRAAGLSRSVPRLKNQKQNPTFRLLQCRIF